jgi:hypothetical protein
MSVLDPIWFRHPVFIRRRPYDAEVIRAALPQAPPSTCPLDLHQGKVREWYRAAPARAVTTDRLRSTASSAGSVKGQVLNQLAAFWFDARVTSSPTTCGRA